MPFIGVLPEREPLFQPQPRRAVGVSDAAAWRLNPGHRHLYDKLRLALAAGLRAAPCGVDPSDCGIAPDALVFVKPIVNLAGMSVRARAMRAAEVPVEAGSFWCEHLDGPHTSSDLLIDAGRLVWQAHTCGSGEKDRSRSLYWDVGVELPELDGILREWVEKSLAGYTGLCNIEMIGGRPIEAHLRGSNGFFDLYGAGFIPAWTALVDGEPFEAPPAVPGGLVISIFGEEPLTPQERTLISEAGVEPWPDPHTPDRIAILRSPDKQAGLGLIARLRQDFGRFTSPED